MLGQWDAMQLLDIQNQQVYGMQTNGFNTV